MRVKEVCALVLDYKMLIIRRIRKCAENRVFEPNFSPVQKKCVDWCIDCCRFSACRQAAVASWRPLVPLWFFASSCLMVSCSPRLIRPKRMVESFALCRQDSSGVRLLVNNIYTSDFPWDRPLGRAKKFLRRGVGLVAATFPRSSLNILESFNLICCRFRKNMLSLQQILNYPF